MVQGNCGICNGGGAVIQGGLGMKRIPSLGRSIVDGNVAERGRCGWINLIKV